MTTVPKVPLKIGWPFTPLSLFPTAVTYNAGGLDWSTSRFDGGEGFNRTGNNSLCATGKQQSPLNIVYNYSRYDQALKPVQASYDQPRTFNVSLSGASSCGLPVAPLCLERLSSQFRQRDHSSKSSNPPLPPERPPLQTTLLAWFGTTASGRMASRRAARSCPCVTCVPRFRQGPWPPCCGFLAPRELRHLRASPALRCPAAAEHAPAAHKRTTRGTGLFQAYVLDAYSAPPTLSPPSLHSSTSTPRRSTPSTGRTSRSRCTCSTSTRRRAAW